MRATGVKSRTALEDLEDCSVLDKEGTKYRLVN